MGILDIVISPADSTGNTVYVHDRPLSCTALIRLPSCRVKRGLDSAVITDRAANVETTT